jgi:hypothetical protein
VSIATLEAMEHSVQHSWRQRSSSRTVEIDPATASRAERQALGSCPVRAARCSGN